MAKRWTVVFSSDCDKAADALGGYIRIDRTLDAFWGGLHSNPHGFPVYLSDWFSIRYIITKPMPGVGPLVWLFTIGTDEVELVHVEDYERYI